MLLTKTKFWNFLSFCRVLKTYTDDIQDIWKFVNIVASLFKFSFYI